MSERIDRYVEIFEAELRLAQLELDALEQRQKELHVTQEQLSAKISARQVQINLLQHYMNAGSKELRLVMNTESPICPLCLARAKGRAPLVVINDGKRHRCEKCLTEFVWHTADAVHPLPTVLFVVPKDAA